MDANQSLFEWWIHPVFWLKWVNSDCKWWVTESLVYGRRVLSLQQKHHLTSFLKALAVFSSGLTGERQGKAPVSMLPLLALLSHRLLPTPLWGHVLKAFSLLWFEEDGILFFLFFLQALPSLHGIGSHLCDKDTWFGFYWPPLRWQQLSCTWVAATSVCSHSLRECL